MVIFEEATKEAFNYYASELTHGSGKLILATCDLCGEFKVTSKSAYRTFCKSCSSILTGKKKGKSNPMYGIPHTEETKALHSAAIKGKNNPMFGIPRTDEQKAKQSVAMTGEKHPNWQGGLSFKPYCTKFDNTYKEKIRNLFGNECFLCTLSEADNGQALSVHHPSYNKRCGCDGTVCKCVPLCISCHSKTNFDRDYWQTLIMEMLKPIEAWI